MSSFYQLLQLLFYRFQECVKLQTGIHRPADIIMLTDVDYVGVLISLAFLFAVRPNEFFLDGLKKLEQRSHNCVEFRGEYVE
jgi:hypothetical protein